MSIEAGRKAEIPLVVTEADTATAFRSGDVPVLATPRVAALMEEAAVAAVASGVDDGFTTVGTHLRVDHLAPSYVGAEVVASARVIRTEGRRIEFFVQLMEGDVVAARGDHLRVLVDREQFVGGG